MSDLEQLHEWAGDLLKEAEAFRDEASESSIGEAVPLRFERWLRGPRGARGLRDEIFAGTQIKPLLEPLIPLRLRTELRDLGARLWEVVMSALVEDRAQPGQATRKRAGDMIVVLRGLISILEAAIASSKPPLALNPTSPTPPIPLGDDTITQLHIKGLRSIDRLVLDVGELKVLIGENGSGKSSVVEACELLRQVPEIDFIGVLDRHHGGLRTLLRHDASAVVLGVRTQGSGGPLLYVIKLGLSGGLYSTVLEEHLEAGSLEREEDTYYVFYRKGERARVLDEPTKQQVEIRAPAGSLLSIANQLPGHEAILRMIDVLARIEVHVPFFTSPSWVTTRMGGATLAARQPNVAQQTERLERFAANLSNAWHTLMNDPARSEEALELVQLGLGAGVQKILTRALVGGQIVMEVKFDAWEQPVPLAGLSDGQVSYLAFVAMATLPRRHALLVFDEPELHMHPGLLVRVLGLFEAMAERGPVVLTTHSDRLLDALRDPVECVRVLELDERRRTLLRQLDGERLRGWLEDYRGLGELRAEGLEPLVLKAPEDGA